MYNTFSKALFLAACIAGVSGVIFGAFGAHFLKNRISLHDHETLKTAVLYLFIHTLAALLVSVIAGNRPKTPAMLKYAGASFIGGIILFSGSLFIIGTAELTHFPVKTIGFITPIGGLSFIAGWFFMMLYVQQPPGKNRD